MYDISVDVKKDVFRTMKFSSLPKQDNGNGCIWFSRNDETFLKKNYFEEIFKVI